MQEFEKHKQIFTDLASLGYKVIYVPEFNMFVEYTSIKPYDPGNSRYVTELKGRDISTLILNHDSNFQDKALIQAKLENIQQLTYKWYYQIKLFEVSNSY